MPHRRSIPLAVMASAALVAGGCGTADDRAQARSVVERFYAAVRDGQGEAACEQLSESTLQQVESQTEQTCDDVITRLSYEGGAVVESHVYLTNAEVGLRSGEYAFLSRERAGWRLTAIACRPQGPPQENPMDCEVEG